mgnify:CR=1 FL=1
MEPALGATLADEEAPPQGDWQAAGDAEAEAGARRAGGDAGGLKWKSRAQLREHSGAMPMPDVGTSDREPGLAAGHAIAGAERGESGRRAAHQRPPPRCCQRSVNLIAFAAG